MIVLDPQKRLTVYQALEHPWVTGKAAKFAHMDSTQKKLQEFNARRKLKVTQKSPVKPQDVSCSPPSLVATKGGLLPLGFGNPVANKCSLGGWLALGSKWHACPSLMTSVPLPTGCHESRGGLQPLGQPRAPRLLQERAQPGGPTRHPPAPRAGERRPRSHRRGRGPRGFSCRAPGPRERCQLQELTLLGAAAGSHPRAIPQGLSEAATGRGRGGGRRSGTGAPRARRGVL